MAVGVTKVGSWGELRRLLSVNQIKGRLASHLRIASMANGQLAVAAVKQNIQHGTYARNRAPNARLTREIKHGRRPLVHTRQLHRAITAVVTDPVRVEVGVRKGDPRAWIALVNHEGITIPVTPAMRAMFHALAIASNGGSPPGGLSQRAAFLLAQKPTGWKPLLPTTTAIRIPSRPFVREVIEDPGFREIVAKNWLRAAALAIADLPLKPSVLQRRL